MASPSSNRHSPRIRMRPLPYYYLNAWILLPIVFLLGWLSGRFSAQQQNPFSTPADVDNGHIFHIAHAQTPARTLSGDTLQSQNVSTFAAGTKPIDSENGWHSVQVFYGDSKPNEDLFANQTWFSQAAQDEIVVGLLHGKRNGYFVDLAANDATLLSNTYALERDYGWTGICIEPNEIYWYKLAHLRTNCQIVSAVVGEQRMESVYFRYEAGDHGGIVGPGFDNGKRWQQSSRHAYTVTLLEILERHDAPLTIDYLSLDVEGAETFIMMNFPLGKYKIKVITAERLRGEIRSYLKEHGFQFVKKLSSWGESLWVHESEIPNLNMQHLERFIFPIV